MRKLFLVASGLMGLIFFGSWLRASGPFYTPYVFTVLNTGNISVGSISGMVTDGQGNLYIDSMGLYKITPDGTITPLPAYSIVPNNLAIDAGGDLIYSFPLNAIQTEIATYSPASAYTFSQPFPNNLLVSGLAVDSAGNIFMGLRSDATVRKIPANGSALSVFVGSPGVYGNADGVGSAASFGPITGLAIDPTNNLYAADPSNNRIRKIAPDGTVTTLAGGSAGFADGPAATAQFYEPECVATDSKGNVYVGDQMNFTVRMISPSGQVTTIAGQPHVHGNALGASDQVLLGQPNQIAVDKNGTIYINDLGNAQLLKGVPAPGFAIVAQPISQTSTAGSSVTFSVSTSAAPDLAYQWNFNGTPISGANASTLTVATTTAANAGNYTVTVTGWSQTLTSIAAALVVNVPPPPGPNITSSPLSQTANVGDTVSFVVTATNAVSFQWIKNGVVVLGATSAVLTLSNVQPSDAGLYQVDAYNGNYTETSLAATLTVVGTATPVLPPIASPTAPNITSNPISQTVNVGNTVSFVVTATNAVSFQWLKDGVAVSGATSAVLTLNNVQPGDAGVYQVDAESGNYIETSLGATLTVVGSAVPIVPPS